MHIFRDLFEKIASFFEHQQKLANFASCAKHEIAKKKSKTQKNSTHLYHHLPTAYPISKICVLLKVT